MAISLNNLETAVTENDKILIALFKEKILGTFDINSLYQKLLWTNEAIEDIELALMEKGVPNADTIPINRLGNIIRSLGVEYEKPAEFDYLCATFAKCNTNKAMCKSFTYNDDVDVVDIGIIHYCITTVDARSALMKHYDEMTEEPVTTIESEPIACGISEISARMINGNYEEVSS